MSLHISRFLEKVRAAESRQQRDITLTVMEARDLHADITKLLLALTALQESQANKSPDLSGPIEFDGGSF
jgi:hypothetical protein